MPVHCGDCGELTFIEDNHRVCPYCHTRTKLKLTAQPRRTQYGQGINRCYECSIPIPTGQTHCPQHEDD